MTYTVDSSLVSYQPIRAGWRDALIAHGAVPGADGILTLYRTWCQTYHIDPNLALAQACQEAAWFTSARWRNEWNPAGLGVVADNTPPNPFKRPQEGVQAHIEHLCCYVYDLAECPADHAHLADRRHLFHDGMPRVRDLVRLPARAWANPGTNYAAAIVAIANSIPDNGGPPVPTQDFPTAADLGFPVRLEATDFVGADRPLADIQWWVQHCTEGHWDGDIAVLTHGSRNGSVHFIIGKEEGQFVASVPIRTTAWTPGNDAVAALSVNVEMSGFADGREGGFTDWQYRANAAAWRWCVAQGMVNVPAVYIGRDNMSDYGPEPDHPGILGHQDVPDPNNGHLYGGASHHTDPGPHWDWNRMIAEINNVAPPPAPADTKINGHVLAGGFRALWDGTPDRLRVMGLPTSEEYDALLGTLPVTAQDFERIQMVYDISTPDPFRVRVPLRDERVKRIAKGAKNP